MPTSFLEACRVTDACYAIGPFFTDGVTLFKQQTRALNLAYLLGESNVVRSVNNNVEGKRIAVIGGGVAGMTAAAALSVMGNNVTLFEQRPVLCHLQNGCDTRWIHPQIYHWPELGSDSPYAAIPLLPWEAGTAFQVSEQLVEVFDDISRTYNIDVKIGATTRIWPDQNSLTWDNSKRPNRGGRLNYDTAIIATGFGIEAGVARGGRFLLAER